MILVTAATDPRSLGCFRQARIDGATRRHSAAAPAASRACLKDAVYQPEPNMKYFIIKYQFKDGTREAWHQQVARFISAVDGDPDLKGKLSYSVMKEREGDGYYHLVRADDQAAKALQTKDFFPRYTEETKRVAGGKVEVVPLEIVAETAYRT
jgi:hypothetical protein